MFFGVWVFFAKGGEDLGKRVRRQEAVGSPSGDKRLCSQERPKKKKKS